jgi:hypothetical protein
MNTTKHSAATCRPNASHFELALAVAEVQGVDPEFAAMADADTLCEILDEGL